LKLEIIDQLITEKIDNSILQLQNANNLFGDATVKLMIWRNATGRYLPDDDKSAILLTIDEATINKVITIPNAGFCEKTINYPSPTSAFKTMSAIKYVLAGLEKREKNLDEIIILDHRGNVSEALSSNVFWKKEHIYFTPPISTGCIEGVMRNWLFLELKRQGYMVEEKLVTPSELLDSSCIFTTNANGICNIRAIDKNKFEIDATVQRIMEKIS